MSVENHITSLQTKHQELERAVSELEAAPSADTLEITRLKKEKLALKEQIVHLKETLH
ncbi:YdcH family protein [Phyllobacterium chamaecytisi]|uniref:YdcH family protein n=1 Tax=Phyllobacterium chamaecytisi TaxID=2876082 RepID=UPI000DD70E45|nr:YdcH family protein [Phyllobacterium sp. KW56]MBZ9603550.1 YdcH family protein [Phyllobacterium sp. KW56]